MLPDERARLDEVTTTTTRARRLAAIRRRVATHGALVTIGDGEALWLLDEVHRLDDEVAELRAQLDARPTVTRANDGGYG